MNKDEVKDALILLLKCEKLENYSLKLYRSIDSINTAHYIISLRTPFERVVLRSFTDVENISRVK